MVDVFRFEKGGLEYARGFLNQEGLSFYVVEGFEEDFYRVVENSLRMDTDYRVETVSALPGSK